MIPSTLARRERTLEWAHAFLEEARQDLERAARQEEDVPPRIRTVHERAGHATPEFRTLGIPLSSDLEGASPDVLSGLIARFARPRDPTCLLLALEAVLQDENGEPRPVLIAEARDRYGARFFMMQPFTRAGRKIDWADPLNGGWSEPGDEEMILDAAFER